MKKKKKRKDCLRPDLVLLLPGLKELHEGAGILQQLGVQAAGAGERQHGLQGSLRLAGRPQAPAGGGQAVVYQALLVLDHLLKDGRLTFDPVEYHRRAEESNFTKVIQLDDPQQLHPIHHRNLI